MSLIKLLLFKPLGQNNDMDEKGNPQDPYRAIFLDVEKVTKKMKRGEHENPYDAFPRAWKHYWQHTVLPKAADAEKSEARMEMPTLWECLEVFQLQKELAQEKYLIPLDKDCTNKLGCDASAKLQNRLTVCYLTKRVVKNLDAYGRAKAAPKTKSYALDADAKEDPGLVREGHGTGDTGESFEPAFEDALDPDIDGEVRLKAGDAPLKVHHPLTSSQCSQAMTFHRQKHTKFVRDMISAGLLPLTGDEEALHRTAAYKRASGTAVNPRAEQLRLKEKAPMITQPLLDAQRAAMTNDSMGLSRLSAERAATSDCAERAGELAANSDVAIPEAEWRTFSKPSAAMARKVAAFEKSAGAIVCLQMVWWGNGCSFTGRREQNTFAKPCAARMPFDWRRWHWQDDNHFRAHAGCFLSLFSSQTRRRRAIHDCHLQPRPIGCHFQWCLSRANMSYCLLVSCSQFAQQAFGLEDKRARDETTLAA